MKLQVGKVPNWKPSSRPNGKKINFKWMKRQVGKRLVGEMSSLQIEKIEN
jgi:hypothetical protein